LDLAVTAGTIIALVGAVVLRLTLGGQYLRYVQSGMRPWLLLAGIALVALGTVGAVRSLLVGTEEEGAHDRPREGWLLLAPIAALLLVAPPALGSYGVDRSAPVDVRSGGSAFSPVPAGPDAVQMSLLEYGQRAFDADGRTVRDATVSLTGFVAGGADSTSFRLARYQISCCAADAAAMIVKVVGISGRAPARDQWVTVTGRYHAAGGDIPELTALTVLPITAPEDPYE
jgi:uncharacterized repeat protein (TIGR03943 family)